MRYLKILKALVIVVSIVSLTSVVCGAGSKPSKITICTSNPGAAWNVIGTAISQVLVNEGVKSNIELGAALSNIVTVSDNKTNLGLTVAAVLPMAYKGDKPFPRPIGNIKSIAALMVNATQIMVTKESGVNTIPDLKGKKFAGQAVGNVSQYAFQLLLKAYGLNESDLKLTRGGLKFGLNQIKDRKAVGFTGTAAFPASAFVDAAVSLDTKLLDVSDDALKFVQNKNSGFFRQIIPAETYKGMTKPTRTMASKTMIITNTGLTEEEAYWLTKTLVENLPTVRKSHAVLRKLTPEFMAQTPAAELHPGAKKYYMEKGYLK